MKEQRFDRAVALRESGRIEEAIREFRSMAAEASDTDERAVYMLNEVTCQASLAHFDEAARVLEDIYKMPPLSPEISISVSFAAARLSGSRGQHESAAHQFAGILREYAFLLNTSEYRSYYEDVCFRRAIHTANAGQFSEAIPLLQEAALFCTLGIDTQQEAHLYLGICFTELDQRDLAKREFLHVIEFGLMNDTELQARYRLAVEYFKDGAFAQSKFHLEAFLSTNTAEVTSEQLQFVYQQLSRACHYLGETENERYYARMSSKSSHP